MYNLERIPLIKEYFRCTTHRHSTLPSGRSFSRSTKISPRLPAAKVVGAADVVHHADYPRKPRGGPDTLPAIYKTRFSFCCNRDECRKRATPPSVRFLGRKIYLGTFVVLIGGMRHGPTPRRVRELATLFGVDSRTIARWEKFWREHFPQSHFWKVSGLA